MRLGTIKTHEVAQAKARCEAEQLRPNLEAMVAKGATLREIASALAGADHPYRSNAQRHSGESASGSTGAAIRPGKTDDAPTP